MALKMCLIGCGGISCSSHGPSYVRYRDSHPGFITAACCDLNKGRLQYYKERFGFLREYTDFRSMIETEWPDVVCVIVAEAAAAAVGQAVLEYGIPMLIEKPPGKTSQDTAKLIDTAERGSVPNMVAFNRRFIPLVKICRQWLDELNEDIRYIRYDFFRYGRNDPDFSDTAIHAIDAVRCIAGQDYTCVRFSYQDIPGRQPSNVYMEASMTNGTMAYLHICPDTGVVMERATIHCGDKTILLRIPIWDNSYDIPGSLELLNKGRVERRALGNELCDSTDVYLTNGFYEENRIFFDSVTSGTFMSSNLKSAYQTMLVKEAYARRAEFWQGA